MNRELRLMANNISSSVDIVRIGIILPEDYMTSIKINLYDQHQFSISPDIPFSKNKQMHVRSEGSELLINNTQSDEFLISSDSNVEASFSIHPARTGRGFHWEKFIVLNLNGNLIIKQHDGYLFVINEITLDQYIAGVVLSEMSPDCPSDFILAQTIAARSWYLANRRRKHEVLGIDVCNDDCCQRYQGIDQFTKNFLKVISKASGIVLTYKDEICDARYSKCCGGITESYENVWQDESVPYLKSIADLSGASDQINTEGLDFNNWIKNAPDANCKPVPNQPKDLIQYLGKVDSEAQYYRWKISYSQAELTNIINKKLHLDIQLITKFSINRRGESGRIIDLTLDYIDSNHKDQKLQLTNEYDIRLTLHKKFLYSSALIIENGPISSGIPDNFIIYGAGWGHGVGLCQMGALNLALKGVNYKSILAQYYPGTTLKNLNDN